MLMLSLVRTLAVTIPWMLNLAIGMLARSLGNLVHDALSVRGAGGRTPQSNADHQPSQVTTKGELR